MLDKERVRLVNVIRALANGLVFSNATAFRFLLQERLPFSAEVIFWIVFVAVLIVVNGWVYFSYDRTHNALLNKFQPMPTKLQDKLEINS